MHLPGDVDEGDIAIIGMACRFPGQATSPERFLDLLREGRNAWSKVPKDRFDINAFRHPNPDARGRTVAEGGYFLEADISRFDANFFSLQPAKVAVMDPEQRMLLEVAYETLEDAEVSIEAISGSETACFVASFSHDYEASVSRDLSQLTPFGATGLTRTMLANHISWFYNLAGPSVSLDTACSGSLTALHLACESLRSKTEGSRCALVGGSSLLIGPGYSCMLSASNVMSPDSRCFTLDARANGYGRGEGVGMIMIKRVEDALREGDTIRAIIRASAANHGGKNPKSVAAPNRGAQERLAGKAHSSRALDPRQTQYVELHGSGTAVGDAVETEAVAAAFSSADRTESPLYCGSVKTNIGHLEGAAGIAGVINCKHGTCACRGASLMPWPPGPVRRCAVNSFGIGGSNANVVLEGVGPRKSVGATETAEEEADRPRLYVLSAPEEAAVARMCGRMARHLGRDEAISMADLAFTLCSRRSRFAWRHAAAASSHHELQRAWEQAPDTAATAPAGGKKPKVVFVFTGQGAPWPGMGRELLAHDVFRASVEAGAALLRELGAGWDARAEVDAPAGPSRVSEAELAHAMGLLLQMALVDLLRHWNVRPWAVVGHSSGEVAAAYAAGALSRRDCLAVSFHRGRLCASGIEQNGAMLAVGLDRDSAASHAAAHGAVIACVNGPRSVTLAGDRPGIAALQRQLESRGVFARRLGISVAYHSPHVHAVAAAYEAALDHVRPRPADAALLFSAVTGRQIAGPELTARYWVRHMCEPVLFHPALADLLQHASLEGPVQLLEVGPHAALAGPVKQHLADAQLCGRVSYLSLLHRDQDAWLSALRATGALWANAVDVDLSKVGNPSLPLLFSRN
ncbi:hypothetical protein CDD83_8461 [Cordyceps sp. RAO-2017]|nr:hypothetical protein CDD83_8461 [Cordyceps sp. RAO-2017]